MFIETEEEELIDFADRITPASWIFPKDYDYVHNTTPGNFYIEIKFRSEPDRKGVAGEVKAIMTYCRGAASLQFHLYSHPNGKDKKESSDRKGTVIHELAHIAVARFALLQKKGRRNEEITVILPSVCLEFNEDPHGATFQAALTVMLARAIKYAGDTLTDDTVDNISVDLMMYAAGRRKSAYERRLVKWLESGGSVLEWEKAGGPRGRRRDDLLQFTSHFLIMSY